MILLDCIFGVLPEIIILLIFAGIFNSLFVCISMGAEMVTGTDGVTVCGGSGTGCDCFCCGCGGVIDVASGTESTIADVVTDFDILAFFFGFSKRAQIKQKSVNR